MIEIPAVVPALPKEVDHNLNLPATMAFTWLKRGWSDIWVRPLTSLVFGVGVTIASILVVGGMIALGWSQVLFPALAGFLVFAPVLAIGLYEKSRRIRHGEPVRMGDVLLPRSGSGGHMFFVGAILSMVMLVWMRAAVLVFALFWGWRAFPELPDLIPILTTTVMGWSLIVVGTLVGALFAAFSFAISVFSLPMLVDKRIDAFTAMGTSMSWAWNNKPVVICWGAIVVAFTTIAVATGFLGFIIIFPWLGHATWHAYLTLRDGV